MVCFSMIQKKSQWFMPESWKNLMNFLAVPGLWWSMRWSYDSKSSRFMNLRQDHFKAKNNNLGNSGFNSVCLIRSTVWFEGNKLIDGGTIQIQCKDLSVDQYPYHKVGSSKTHWHKYNYVFDQKNEYSKKLLTSFTETLGEILKNSRGMTHSHISWTNVDLKVLYT